MIPAYASNSKKQELIFLENLYLKKFSFIIAAEIPDFRRHHIPMIIHP